MRILSGKVMKCFGNDNVDVRNAGDFSESWCGGELGCWYWSPSFHIYSFPESWFKWIKQTPSNNILLWKKHECFLHAQNPTFFGDEVIQFHMNYLRNELMEQNFLKIVEPYNVVEIQFVAEKMDLPVDEVYYENSQLFIDCKEIVADDSGQKTPSQFRWRKRVTYYDSTWFYTCLIMNCVSSVGNCRECTGDDWYVEWSGRCIKNKSRCV